MHKMKKHSAKPSLTSERHIVVKHSFRESYFSLIVWIGALILIGSLIGFFTQTDVDIWYKTLNRSPLTPPNYVFPIAWTILYGLIGATGWTIWKAPSFPERRLIKYLYIMQLLLNWSWTPLFFTLHLTGTSLICILVMDVVVASIVYLGYTKLRWASLLMIPYLLWILFATHLNFYIWQYN